MLIPPIEVSVKGLVNSCSISEAFTNPNCCIVVNGIRSFKVCSYKEKPAEYRSSDGANRGFDQVGTRRNTGAYCSLSGNDAIRSLTDDDLLSDPCYSLLRNSSKRMMYTKSQTQFG